MKHWRFLLGGAAILSVFGSALTANASTLVGSGLTVSPITQNISAEPGETVAATIKVSNPTDSTVTAYPLSLDFRSDGTTGQPSFYKASSGSDRFSLSAWYHPDQSVIVVPSGQSIEFGYHVQVPVGAEAGGHYGAALFADSASGTLATGTKVSVKSMVGTLLFLRVAGDIQESAVLVNFLSNKFISLGNSIAFSYQIKNVGNIHIQPYGELIIKNWVGKTVSDQKINPTQGNILPDSSRVFDSNWTGSKWSVGHYTADLAAFYGTTNQSIGGQLDFWIIPLWMIIAAAALLILLYLLVRFRPRIQIQVSTPKNLRKP